MTGRSTGTLTGDIALLRNEGVSDDEILKSYRGWRSYHNSDIDKLIGEGVSATKIMDGLGEYDALYPEPPESSDGALETTRKALQHGTAQAAVGLGRTAYRLGEASGIETAKDIGKGIADFGHGMAPENYRPASGDFMNPHARDRGLGGFGWSYLPRMVLEGAPGLAADIGAGALAGPGGFLASSAARTFGPAVDARVENNGGKEATATDYAISAGSSALQAGLSRVGLSPALSGVTKGAGLGAIAQIPGQIAKAGVVDAASGVAGSVIDQAAVSVGTDNGLSIDAHQALGAGAASGATAGGLRTLRSVGDIANAIRYADFDPQVANRLVGRFDKLKIDPESPEGAAKAMHIAESVLNADIQRSRNSFSFQVGGEKSRRAAQAMDTAQASLGEGAKLTSKDIDDIREAVGDNHYGLRYLEAIEDHSALNRLKEMGRLESDYFAGGVSSIPFVENTINPASWLKSPTKAAIGSTAAMIGLGSELAQAQALFHPLALAKTLAAQGALYGGIRAFDGITASRNPLQELRGRFGGDGVPGLPKAPEPVKAQAEPFPMQRALTGPESAQLQDAVSKAVSPSPRTMSDAETSQMLDAVRKAAGEGVEAQGRAGIGKGSQEAPEAASGAPGGSGEGINPDTVRIQVGDYVVERPKSEIGNVNAYVSKTRQHMQSRVKLGEELGYIAGPKYAGVFKAMVQRLNLQARSFDDAYYTVEDAINSIPYALRSKAWDTYHKHEPELKATYRR